eukprot:74061_1
MIKDKAGRCNVEMYFPHFGAVLMDIVNDVCATGFLTVFFIANWIFYNRYELPGPSESFWTMNIIRIATIIFVIKTIFISPFYTIFLFIFHGFNSIPNCNNFTWNILLITIIPI